MMRSVPQVVMMLYGYLLMSCFSQSGPLTVTPMVPSYYFSWT